MIPINKRFSRLEWPAPYIINRLEQLEKRAFGGIFQIPPQPEFSPLLQNATNQDAFQGMITIPKPNEQTITQEAVFMTSEEQKPEILCQPQL